MTPVEIVFHPAKGSPKKAAFLGFLLGIAFQALWQWLEPASAVALCGVLLFSLRDFFLETRYVLGDEGVSVRGALKSTRVYPWKRFRAFVEDRNGLFLTPYLEKKANEAKRGVFLPMTREDRLRAVETCEAMSLARRAA